jgi:hypothetical protein
MKRLYRGEKFFLPRQEVGPVGLVTASLRYSGYQIAYTLWGKEDVNIHCCRVILKLIALTSKVGLSCLSYCLSFSLELLLSSTSN